MCIGLAHLVLWKWFSSVLPQFLECLGVSVGNTVYLGTIQILCIWTQYRYCVSGHTTNTVYLDTIQILCIWTHYKYCVSGHNTNTVYLDTIQILLFGWFVGWVEWFGIGEWFVCLVGWFVVLSDLA